MSEAIRSDFPRAASRSPMRVAKRLAFALASALVLPLTAGARIERRCSSGEGFFVFASQLLSLVPGLPGVVMRAAFHHRALDRCDPEVHIGFGSTFTHRGATLGPHVSLGAYCVIGHADIGAGVMMASRVSIPSGKRQHLDASGALTRTARFERVRIGRGCWIGEGAIVMADIGDESIVSAGAVVLRAAPAASVVSGNPASVARRRGVPDATIEADGR